MLVRHGSLAAAAGVLGVNYTTVARRIRRAEEALDLRLFEKHVGGYVPTKAAHQIAEDAARMEELEHQLMRSLAGAEDGLSGRLTITAPQLLIANVLAPVIAEFTEAHPQIDLRVLATNDLLDLTRREADLAIRISRDPGDTLKGLRILQQDTASFARLDVAERIAANPEMCVDWIVYDQHPDVPRGIAAGYPNNRVRYRFDDMVAMLGAAQAGLGVVRVPMFLGRAMQDLEQVPVLPPQPYADIWTVAHPDVWPSAKLRAFRDCLLRFCKSNKALFVA